MFVAFGVLRRPRSRRFVPSRVGPCSSQRVPEVRKELGSFVNRELAKRLKTLVGPRDDFLYLRRCEIRELFRSPHQQTGLQLQIPPYSYLLLYSCLGSAHRKSLSHSTAPVVELGEVEPRHPVLAAPREDFGLRREPLVEAIESAFLHINDARTILQVVGDHPGTAVGAKDAIEPLVRTCFGVRTVGEALGASAQHGEIRVRHHHPCCHLCAGRSLAIRAVAVCDEGRLGMEPIRHLTAGTVTGVLLGHIIPPKERTNIGRLQYVWLCSGCCALHHAASSNLIIFSATPFAEAGFWPVTSRPSATLNACHGPALWKIAPCFVSADSSMKGTSALA